MSACLDAAVSLPPCALEEAGDVGSLERLHDPGLGIAEGQREVHRGVGPRRREEALDVHEGVAGGDDDGALDDIVELPHIARPRVTDERLKARRCDGPDALLRPPARLLEEVLGEERDVLGALAQCGNADRHDGQAIEEIAPEGPALDLGLQVLVGGGDEPHVDVHGAVGADGCHLLLLDRPQQLALQMQGHLPDLVEEQGAAARHLEVPAPVLGGAREGPLRAPNSSDSNSSAGIAAQLTATKGRSRRQPEKWIDRASSSFPTPVSPWIRTVVSRSTTERTRSKIPCMPALRAMILLKVKRSWFRRMVRRLAD